MIAENHAIVYCEGAFNTPNGKTAHGLVRYSNRYKVLAVVDTNYAGKDAGDVLDGKMNQIAVVASLNDALMMAKDKKVKPKYFVIGLAPDGGKMSPEVRQVIREAIKANLNVDSGLHDFLSDEIDIINLAKRHKVQLRDIRKPPGRKDLHFFSGKIQEVNSLKMAILGTDSAIGKRTTAWILVNSLREMGIRSELIGTGQTAWMQGAEYSIILDSLINDFVTGEIEHVVWRAWDEKKPDVLIIEGQGGLLNPAYPGGFEILAAARPDLIILQHAPARKEYDGFPGYPIHPIEIQIKAIEIISGKPVFAITINHENLNLKEIDSEIKKISAKVKLPVYDLLIDRGHDLSQLVLSKIKNRK
jgi:uncharacterized NAD-dependent epimerase/dehydratase family protein